MLKYVIALLCGTSITGSVYMAGWGSRSCPLPDNDDCCAPQAKMMVVSDVTTAATSGKIDVANTKCIVMAEDISNRTVEYQGKIYHICCEDCAATFNKDPEKYVKALEADPAKFGVPKK